MTTLLLPTFPHLKNVAFTHSFIQHIFVESLMPGSVVGTGPGDKVPTRLELIVWLGAGGQGLNLGPAGCCLCYLGEAT